MYRRNVGLSRADSVWVGAGQGCDWGPDMIEKIETMVSSQLQCLSSLLSLSIVFGNYNIGLFCGYLCSTFCRWSQGGR